MVDYVLLQVYVTLENALGDRPTDDWIDEVLVLYPLGPVLHLYTRMLHTVEIAVNPTEATLELLPAIALPRTVSGVGREVQGGDRDRPGRGHRQAQGERLPARDALSGLGKDPDPPAGRVRGSAGISPRVPTTLAP